jgi:hypothetical protein
MLWMGVLCLVAWCVAISDHHAPRGQIHIKYDIANFLLSQGNMFEKEINRGNSFIRTKGEVIWRDGNTGTGK